MNPQIEDHMDWLYAFDLTDEQLESVDMFYQDWETQGFLPELTNYITLNEDGEPA